MTEPILSAIESLFLEPTFGIPVLVTVWALVAWVAWVPPVGERRPSGLRRSWGPPNEDLPSQVYYALADGRYSSVLDAAAARFDEAVQQHRGRSAYSLPITRRGAIRAGIPESRELRRTVRAISSVHARAMEREGRFFIRWRFWRSREADEAEFLRRVDAAIARAADWSNYLEENG